MRTIENQHYKELFWVLSFFFLFHYSCYSQSPGNVSTGLEAWVKANEGANNTTNTQATDGQTVVDWVDQSAFNNNFNQTDNTQKPIYRNSGIGSVNFNPSLEFLGAGDNTQLINNTLNLDYDVTLFGVWFFQEQLAGGSYIRTILVSGDQHAGGGTSAAGYMFGTGRVLTNTLIYSSPGDPATGGAYLNTSEINNNYHIGELLDNLGTGKMYYDGILKSTTTHATNVGTFTTGYEIGAHENANGSNQSSRYYKGYLAEVIAYDSPLNNVDRRKVESYLAIKYGITLGVNGISLDYTSSNNTFVWGDTQNAGYAFDIAGIALDVDSDLDQPKSHSINKNVGVLRDIVTIANGTNFTNPTSVGVDQSFLVWGHNDLSINCSANDVGITLNDESIGERFERIWKVQETGTVGLTTIEFDMTNSNLGNWGVSDYRLLVDTDANFSTGATSVAPSFIDVVNNKIYFEHDFNTGNFFTVGVVHTEFTIAGTATVCEGESTDLVVGFIGVNGPEDISYTDGTNSFMIPNALNNTVVSVTPSATTTYSIDNSSNTTCYNYNQSAVTVTVDTIPDASFTGIQSIVCEDVSPITLTPLYTGGTFSGTGIIGTSFNPVVANIGGPYEILHIITNGTCSDSSTQFITVASLPTVIANTSADTVCPGDLVTLTVSGADSYIWDNGVLDGVSFSVDVPTTYSVDGEDINGCINTSQITVNLFPEKTIEILGQTTICKEPILLELPGQFSSYLWQNEYTTSTMEVTNAGDYFVFAVDNAGCEYTGSIVVEFECPPTLIIPNVFTPNYDGENDRFICTGPGINNSELMIYNRWGQVIFEGEALSFGWNGRTVSGNICPEGVYLIIVKYDYFENGVLMEKEISGHCTLMR